VSTVSEVILIFFPFASKVNILPSVLQELLTHVNLWTLPNNSLFSDVRSSTMTTPDPLSFRRFCMTFVFVRLWIILKLMLLGLSLLKVPSLWTTSISDFENGSQSFTLIKFTTFSRHSSEVFLGLLSSDYSAVLSHLF